jgi:hypothetical protein
MMNVGKLLSVRRTGKSIALSMACTGLAGLSLVVSIGSAAGGTIGQALTCEQMEQKCLARVGKPKPQTPGKPAPSDPALAREHCDSS